MRRLITGVDGAGRSCVVSDGALGPPEIVHGQAVNLVYDAGVAPPEVPAAGGGLPTRTQHVPGQVLWHHVSWQGNVEVPMHNTDTIDFDFIISGSTTLILDDGEHELRAGDSVVVTGVDHAWRTGPDGAEVATVSVGTVGRSG
jgi:hypothetical protein